MRSYRTAFKNIQRALAKQLTELRGKLWVTAFMPFVAPTQNGKHGASNNTVIEFNCVSVSCVRNSPQYSLQNTESIVNSLVSKTCQSRILYYGITPPSIYEFYPHLLRLKNMKNSYRTFSHLFVSTMLTWTRSAWNWIGIYKRIDETVFSTAKREISFLMSAYKKRITKTKAVHSWFLTSIKCTNRIRMISHRRHNTL